ncbi:hypothetical protein BUALT_Bualt07G0044400 [Buddleja alternifolia]|uniref:Uncharacterized protein n=1 Tax=Buddleja alternifolia TaxID=168488 RepID=A0AAV6X7C5_9LAMI|nr:hypothetical protein BUALT_Bualt07G0044400 [Buddleja alternifolia]
MVQNKSKALQNMCNVVYSSDFEEEDGTDNQKKGTKLMELYACGIEMYIKTKNHNLKLVIGKKKMKSYLNGVGIIGESIISYKSTIPHPIIPGIIRECSGRINIAERQWTDAAADFLKLLRTMMKLGTRGVFDA